MQLDSLFLDEDDDQGRTKLDRPVPDGCRIMAIDQDALNLLYSARNRDEEALITILSILADQSVTSVRVIAERAVIEYSVSLERDGRRNLLPIS